ncbi:MAG: ABC transporter permease [Parafannyhessea sp.]|uniref:ABC transporter permease n=1 Tax=Parafannyhessea sp. TaxID=2847324 RepID=UPI003F0848C1
MNAEKNAATISAKDAWYPPAKRDRFILKQLVSKDFKLKYRRSALGVVWSVLNPLLMMLVMAAVFGSFMRYNDPSLGNYAVYLILGNTAFQLMSDATSQGMNSIIWASSLLKKVKINRYVFPVQKVLFAVVNYGFSLIAIALVMVVERVPLTWTAILMPYALLTLMVFCIGLSLFLSAAAVFFRDVIHLWSVVLTAWTYATPLFYPFKILPHWMQVAEHFNPMYIYITYIRDVILYHTIPSVNMHIACLGFAVVALAIGYAVFHRHEHKFILYI